jgi:hypothetical protein
MSGGVADPDAVDRASVDGQGHAESYETPGYSISAISRATRL